jgi:hypothetical protein
MSSLLAHIAALDTTTLVAVFALGWFLGGIATAKLLRRSSRSTQG